MARLGVTLGLGDTIDAPIVAAACDPKQVFLELLAGGLVPFEREIENFRARGTTAKVHLGIEGELEPSGRPGEAHEFMRSGGARSLAPPAADESQKPPGRQAASPSISLRF